MQLLICPQPIHKPRHSHIALLLGRLRSQSNMMHIVVIDILITLIILNHLIVILTKLVLVLTPSRFGVARFTKECDVIDAVFVWFGCVPNVEIVVVLCSNEIRPRINIKWFLRLDAVTMQIKFHIHQFIPMRQHSTIAIH